MTDAELARLFRRLGRDLDAKQRAQLRRLRDMEAALFSAIIVELSKVLTLDGGRIASRITETGINRAIDAASRQVDMTAFGREFVRDIKGILAGNAEYYRNDYEGRKGFGTTKQRVNDQVMKRLGVDGTKLVKGGYLITLLNSRRYVEQIRATVTASVAAKDTMARLTEALRVTVKGTRQQDGALVRELGEPVVDTYHQADRSASTGFGQALKYKWATYEGGLIETSRQFCIDRDGKVFNTVEAEQWRHDPKLPRTTREKQTGIVTGYTPLASLSNSYGDTSTSMGRWRCRHRPRWISEQMAKRLAPEKFN